VIWLIFCSTTSSRRFCLLFNLSHLRTFLWFFVCEISLFLSLSLSLSLSLYVCVDDVRSELGYTIEFVGLCTTVYWILAWRNHHCKTKISSHSIFSRSLRSVGCMCLFNLSLSLLLNYWLRTYTVIVILVLKQTLQSIGFDWTYDKGLYDRLGNGNLDSLRGYISNLPMSYHLHAARCTRSLPPFNQSLSHLNDTKRVVMLSVRLIMLMIVCMLCCVGG
jgi:hypothetical protein